MPRPTQPSGQRPKTRQTKRPTKHSAHQPIPWVTALDRLPPAASALQQPPELAGLVCAGQDLSAERLQEAYSQGIFPWYSDGQPVLWWSTQPRMVLQIADFKVSHSLRKLIKTALLRDQSYQLRYNDDFAGVMQACAQQRRRGQDGTWIQPELVRAYTELHRQGHAHCISLHTANGERVAGLYCVVLGQAVFGESMYTTVRDGSKLCLAGLVAWCQQAGVQLIDCQQETAHMASLGAAPIDRAAFVAHIAHAQWQPKAGFKMDSSTLNQALRL